MSSMTETPPRPAASTVRDDILDLLASMRFAIAMLTIICIVSSIGTVLKQGEPLVNYVDAFGPFWAEVFSALGLFRIYSSPWFLMLLAFLVLSTSLCIIRNTPKIITDLRTFKEHIRVQALNAFHHKASGALSTSLEASRDSVVSTLSTLGWQVKTESRMGQGQEAPGVMIAARRGMVNKLGYIAAHSSIVLICLGGLFDGDVVAKVQAWAQGLETFKSGQPTVKNKLSMNNLAYRASLYVPEGESTGLAVINLEKGMLVQPLPFDVELKKFIVNYYDTGMPKRFASEIIVHDLRDGSKHEATVEVNKPFVYDGISIFQSSFQDGGSIVRLRPIALGGAMPGLDVISGEVGGKGIQLPPELTRGEPLSLEITELRAINVEDMGGASGGEDPQTSSAEGVDARGVNFQSLTKQMGSGANRSGKKLTNIGPSVTYKLRDSAGQAREFQNFMVPVRLNGQSVFMLGARSTQMERFRFARIPADENMTMAGWVNLRNALFDPAMREEAAGRFAAVGAESTKPEMVSQLKVSAQHIVDIYAGAPYEKDMQNVGGLPGLSTFIEKVVPENDRERASETMLRILHGTMFQLYNLSRERAALPPAKDTEQATRDFLTQSVLSISDVIAYPAPVMFALDGFDQKQASVFQVTKTPGRNVVYLGCVLLIVGVFSMLYVRERRVWVWLQDQGHGAGTELKMALSSTRQTMDVDAEFDRLRAALLPASNGQEKVN
jgi:cytochrome c biogenesis protein